MKRSSISLRLAAYITTFTFCITVLSPSTALLPSALAFADDYSVSGGDPSMLPNVGAASVPLGEITLTDTDGDDFSSENMTETLRVAINTTDYANVAFDTSLDSTNLTIGGTCGHTSAQNLSFSDSHTADILVTGAGGIGNCNPGETITIDGLKIQTTGQAPSPVAPAPLISVDNVFTSTGSPISASTLIAYSISYPDMGATMTFSNPIIGDVGDATLSITLPYALDQDDAIVIDFPGHLNLSGMNMATTGTLGSFNCTGLGSIATCTASGNTNISGTLVMTGIIAAYGSTDDVLSVKLANEGNIGDIITEDTTVPTTDIAANSDNIITNIDVQDTNTDGTIDSFLLSVDNQSHSTAASHNTAGWTVTDNGQNVTVHQVSIVGSANADPLMIRVDLDTSDPDLEQHNTATDMLELSYTAQGTDEGFEFDDISDIQLTDIFSGDTGPGDTENDKAMPVLLSWNFATANNVITQQWSEPVIIGSITPTKLILQDSSTATTSYTLTGGTPSSLTASKFSLTPASPDQTAINARTGLLKTASNSYIRFDSGFLTDTAGNSNAVLSDGHALHVTSFSGPVVTPVIYSGGGGGGGGITPTAPITTSPLTTFSTPTNLILNSAVTNTHVTVNNSISVPLTNTTYKQNIPLTGSGGSIEIISSGGSVVIGENTTVSTQNTWDGVIKAPQAVPVETIMTSSGTVLINNGGQQQSISSGAVLEVVKVGSDTSPLLFDGSVRLSIHFAASLSQQSDLNPFLNSLLNDLSSATAVNKDRFKIVSITNPDATSSEDTCPYNTRASTEIFGEGNSFTANIPICHMSYYAVVLTDALYTDVATDHPFINAIRYLTNHNIIRGNPDHTFQPDRVMNRAEFTKMIIEAQYPINPSDFAQNCFTDVKKDAWYAGYVCFAKKNNILQGYEDGSFKPEAPVNLAEASKILTRAFQIPLDETSGKAWFNTYVKTLQAEKYIPVSFIIPAQQIRRGDAAEMLWRILEEVHTLPSAVLIK